MQIVTVNITTDADGAAEAYSDVKVRGQIVGYFLDVGETPNTTDWTITTEDSAQAVEGLTDVAANVAAVEAALTLAAVCFNERIKVVIAQGGDTKDASIRFAVQDEYVVYT